MSSAQFVEFRPKRIGGPLSLSIRATPQLVVRSILFNILFYIVLMAHAIAALPALAMPRVISLALLRSWCRCSNWLLRVICNIHVEYRGREKIPSGAFIIACKHQSFWEGFGLSAAFSDPIYILKRELMWIPLFGWWAWKCGMIPIDRTAGPQALRRMTQRVRAALEQGRQIIIFPEGTRRAPGAAPAYKCGVAHLYGETRTTCLPVALNSGLYWPRRSFRRNPGTIVFEMLDPISAGLDKRAFLGRLQGQIETATGQLLAEGRCKAPRSSALKT